MNNFTRLLNTKQFREALLTAERNVYEKAWEHASRNQSRVASLVGVARGTAITKLKQYGLI
jgi:DNA-binding protein Fis